MNLRTKKKLTFVSIGAQMFFSGVEYAVIIPTLWLYIEQKFGAQFYLMGLVLSAYPLAGLIFSPILGKLSDRTGDTKTLLLIANTCEIVGSVMYWLGINGWFLIASRFVAGIGSGVISPLFADITRVTTVEERTPTLSLFMAVRQFGLIIGPAFNLFLMKINFSIAGHPVNNLNSAGLFMAVLWSVYTIFVVFFYTNLPKLQAQIKRDELITANQIDTSDINETSPSINVSSNDTTRYQTISTTTTSDERPIIPASSKGHRTYSIHSDTTTAAVVPQPVSPPSEIRRRNHGDQDDHLRIDTSADITAGTQRAEKQTWGVIYDVHMREEIIVLLAMVFASYFNQMCLETVFTKMSAIYLGFGPMENSLLFSASGAQILLVFILIRYLSKRGLSDRSFLFIGMVCILLAVIGLMVFTLVAEKNHDSYGYHLVYFIMIVIVDLLGLPMIVVASASMFSKITQEETQGFSQSLRRMVGSIAFIIAPIWMSSAYDYPRILYGTIIAINLFTLILYMVSYKKLVAHMPDDIITTVGDGEREPLLSTNQNC